MLMIHIKNDPLVFDTDSIQELVAANFLHCVSSHSAQINVAQRLFNAISFSSRQFGEMLFYLVHLLFLLVLSKLGVQVSPVCHAGTLIFWRLKLRYTRVH